MTVMRSNIADGSRRTISLGKAGASDRWVLRLDDSRPSGYRWEPPPP
jgi:hypothetical protein